MIDPGGGRLDPFIGFRFSIFLMTKMLLVLIVVSTLVVNPFHVSASVCHELPTTGRVEREFRRATGDARANYCHRHGQAPPPMKCVYTPHACKVAMESGGPLQGSCCKLVTDYTHEHPASCDTKLPPTPYAEKFAKLTLEGRKQYCRGFDDKDGEGNEFHCVYDPHACPAGSVSAALDGRVSCCKKEYPFKEKNEKPLEDMQAKTAPQVPQ